MVATSLPDTSHTFLVGLGHKARHGKDTMANLLVDIFRGLGITARKYSFAGALYDYCRVVHGMSGKDAPLLQKVGVEMREKDKMVWVKTVLWKIHDDRPDIALIPDTRFENEADAIRSKGGLVVKVSRYLPSGEEFRDPSRPAGHISETALDDYRFDMTVFNRDDAKALESKALTLAGQVLYHARRR